MDSNGVIKLRVQGVCFEFDRLFVLTHDWILSRIVACDAVSSTPTKMIIIDCDSQSFRLLVTVLQENIELSDEDLSYIFSSKLEWMLFKSTLTLLQCHAVLERIEIYEKSNCINAVPVVPHSDIKQRPACYSATIVLKDGYDESLHYTSPITLCSTTTAFLSRRKQVNCAAAGTETNDTIPSTNVSRVDFDDLVFTGVLECWA